MRRYWKNKKILIAEDYKMVREDLIESLRNYGEVTGAEDGKQALEFIILCPPDLLITDFQMPQMSGVELINELGKKNYNFPIILNSERIEDINKNQIKYEGEVEFLEKPFDIKSLYEKINSLLA